jgi:hypothetical protein
MKIKNIDKFGHCVVCHRNLVKNVVINGKQEGVFDGDKTEAYMKLNTGSLLPISICRQCLATTDLNDPKVHSQILEAVNNGWALEIDHMKRNPEKFPEFTAEKERTLKEFYANLHITGHEKHHKVGV